MVIAQVTAAAAAIVSSDCYSMYRFQFCYFEIDFEIITLG